MRRADRYPFRVLCHDILGVRCTQSRHTSMDAARKACARYQREADDNAVAVWFTVPHDATLDTL